ncbi:SRPBCC family protein [Sinomicrobium oceani]|uniref:SRPBCC family protein n=1 Tax=Sinomicrobium oceani TaxID=1150368 RepID=UPI00227BA2B8|nr:SRPBCC family protein [Sinomicrobium oceani]
MPKIELHTEIQAARKIVFDLSRSIDLHKVSTAHTQETAVAGKTSGFIGLNETVTWRAKHFGIYQKMTVRITAFESPDYFADEMVRGAFHEFKHEHYFKESGGITVMTDVFNYRSPLGFVGRWADILFLKEYMTDLLATRNRVIKEFAESGKWKTLFTV